MAEGLITFASAFAPRPITYRTIDFRTNEFRGLEGGDVFEPDEANPMIGYRGALRYVREPDLLPARARRARPRLRRRARERAPDAPVRAHAARVRARAAAVVRGRTARPPGFELWMMAEVPSVLFHLERYAEIGVTGISIGSNDLTQLMLGVDRDSEVLADIFDERDPAVVAVPAAS